ncbi:hypothetical protein RvY_19074-3 [Ramazzottius varieornatus]|uniref:Uncharacterized protein n=1 Tax=Ramazzottius varieornatus TaxID=947166 RepID=A0A1D1WBJ2_RAMVA|nr:hypothetical protein RvY_19074-3 [Ramazzottius varieornatus]
MDDGVANLAQKEAGVGVVGQEAPDPDHIAQSRPLTLWKRIWKTMLTRIWKATTTRLWRMDQSTTLTCSLHRILILLSS